MSLGVRPEDMRLADGPGANVLSARIEHIEKLGEASLLYLGTSGAQQLLTVKVHGTTRHRTPELPA